VNEALADQTCVANPLQELMEAYHYIEQNQGKGIRDLLIDAFNIWLQLDPVELSKIKYVVRMLHNASLLYAV
jgi:geranylgeranyl diphosphate synthase, type III